jgi:hypothetical protein
VDDKKQELAKQLSTYADNFAAFSFVQGAAFCYLLVQSLPVGCTLRSRWYIAEPLLLIAGVGYYWLICRCHTGEDKLLGASPVPGDTVGDVVIMVRHVRITLVVIATLGEMAIVIGARFCSPALERACALGCKA